MRERVQKPLSSPIYGQHNPRTNHQLTIMSQCCAISYLCIPKFSWLKLPKLMGIDDKFHQQGYLARSFRSAGVWATPDSQYLRSNHIPTCVFIVKKHGVYISMYIYIHTYCSIYNNNNIVYLYELHAYNTVYTWCSIISMYSILYIYYRCKLVYEY